MRFGICTSIANSAAVKAAGWDYIEENVQNFLQAYVPDSQWDGDKQAATAQVPVLAACCLLPGPLKVTGPGADIEKLQAYIKTVMPRAKKCGTKTLVFGSGVARQIPEGFDRAKAMKQIVEFARMAAEIAALHGVTLVAEHLNRRECNVLNTVAEAEELVKQVDHPHFQNLVDGYHFWLEEESLADLKKRMPLIRHVHLADLEGRVPPGESGKSDFRPFFRVLKDFGYDGLISVESPGFDDIAGQGPRVLAFLKKQWTEA